MKRCYVLLLCTVLLAGCSAGNSGADTRVPAPPPPVEMKKVQPTYEPMQPLVEEKVLGFSFKRPTDWAKQTESDDFALYAFGGSPGVASAAFLASRPKPETQAVKWKVTMPFDPARVHEAWLAAQKADVRRKWQVVSDGLSSAGGLSGFRVELSGGTEQFRVDNVTYVLTGPETLLLLELQLETPRQAFNAQRWAGMKKGLDDLVATLQPAT